MIRVNLKKTNAFENLSCDEGVKSYIVSHTRTHARTFTRTYKRFPTYESHETQSCIIVKICYVSRPPSSQAKVLTKSTSFLRYW